VALSTPLATLGHRSGAPRPTSPSPPLTPPTLDARGRLIKVMFCLIADQRRRPGRPRSTRSIEASTCRTTRRARSGLGPPAAPARPPQVASRVPLLAPALGTNAVGCRSPSALLAARERATSIAELLGRISACQPCPSRMFVVGHRVRAGSLGEAPRFGMMIKLLCVASVTMTLI
jgi:hypothetical protein